MALLVTVKHLTKIKGLPYFQRRIPKRLLQHSAVKSSHYKVRLPVDPNDEIALLSALNRANEVFTVYVETLTNANLEALSELDLERRALLYLEANGFEPGLAATRDPKLNDLVQDHAWHSGAFDELTDFNEDEAKPMSDQIKVQDVAWSLLTQRRPHLNLPKTLQELFDQHWLDTGKSEDDKRDRKAKALWQEFLLLSGGDTVCEKTVLQDALRRYANAKLEQGNKPSSIARNITTILQPIKHHNTQCASADIIEIIRPKLPNTRSTDRKKPLYHLEQQQLSEKLTDEVEWKQLYVLLALHTGLHPSEAIQLKEQHFSFRGDIWTVTVSGNDTQRKTQERGRIVPLVFESERIKALVENDCLTEMGKKTADNVGQQIRVVLQKVDTSASAYTLRHTLKHNLDSAAVSPFIQREIGGWIKQDMHLSQHMAEYGSLGSDSKERLLPRESALNAALAHLM
ncbi:MAG: hypothetical protein CMN49_00710 [SAR116 cluster bacterium]|nr:hypothetical protein [SAR116 cluster bacterium]